METTLVAFMQQFMTRMNESAESSMARLGDTLSGTMRELSANVSELGQKMAVSLQQNAEKAAGAAATVAEQAGTWSARSAEQIDQLTKLQENHAAHMKEVETTLAAFMQKFMAKLDESAGASVNGVEGALSDVRGELSACVNELEQKLTASMLQNAEKAAGAASTVVEQAGAWSARSAEQIDQLSKLQESHAAHMKEVETALATFMQKFATQLDDTAGASVTGIGDALSDVRHELSTCVDELEQKLTASMLQNAEKAAGAAASVVEQAGAWSAQSAEQIDQLSKLQGSHAAHVKEVEATLAAFMQKFMAQLDDTAGASVTGIGDALSDVRRELSACMSELEQTLTASMLQNADKVAGAAAAVVEEAGSWSSRNAEQVDQLAKLQEEHAKQIREVESTLATFMQEFMAQMNESAGASVIGIGGAVSDVARVLSSHVSQFEQKMADFIQQSAEKTASAANAVVEQAETWSARSAEQLDQLMKLQESQTIQIKEVEATLDAFMQRFIAQMNESAGASAAGVGGALADVTQELSVFVSELERKLTASAQQIAEKTASAANAVVEQAGMWSARGEEQIDQLVKLQEGHAAQLNEVQGTLDAFMQKIVTEMKESAAASATGIGGELADKTRELSAYVNELEQKTAASMQQITEKASEAVNAVVEQTGAWSARGADRIDQLVKLQESHAVQMKDVEAALAAFMQKLISQVNESAGASVAGIGSALTDVMHKMSAHVNELEQKMAASIQETAETAANAAYAVVEQAGAWSTRSAEQIDQLLKLQEIHAQQMETALDAFMQKFMTHVNESAGQPSAEIGVSLTEVTRELSAHVGDLEQKMTASIRETAEKAAGAASDVVERAGAWSAQITQRLEQLLRHQESQAQQVESRLGDFMQQFMGQMNDSAGATVTRIESALTDAMGELSTHVSELEQKMAASMQQNAERMADTATAVVEQAGEWSARSAEQIDQVLKQQESHARQVESRLGDFMQQFMGQMSESAGASMTRIESALAGAMGELSTHVSELEQKIAASIQLHAEAAAGAASAVVEQAGDLSARSTQQLDQVLKQQESQAQQMESRLGDFMQQFMAQMNESANASVARIGDALTGIMHELSTHASELEQKMAASVEQNAEKVAGAATASVEKSGAWQSQTAQQLDQLLKQQEGQAKQMEAAFVAFMQQHMAQMNESAGASASAIGDALTGVIRELSTHMSELERKMTASMQENAEKAAGAVTSVVDQTGVWSTRNAQQFEELARQQESQAKQLKNLDAKLVSFARHLMVRMNDSAGTSVARITDALSDAMRKLSSHVSELERKMTASMHKTAETATGAAEPFLAPLAGPIQIPLPGTEQSDLSDTLAPLSIPDADVEPEPPVLEIRSDVSEIRVLPETPTEDGQEKAFDAEAQSDIPGASLQLEALASEQQEAASPDSIMPTGPSDQELIETGDFAGSSAEEVYHDERDALLAEEAAQADGTPYEFDLTCEPSPDPLTHPYVDDLQFPRLDSRNETVTPEPDGGIAASTELPGFESDVIPAFIPEGAPRESCFEQDERSSAAEGEAAVDDRYAELSDELDGFDRLAETESINGTIQRLDIHLSASPGQKVAAEEDEPGEEDALEAFIESAEDQEKETILSELDSSEFEITAALRQSMADAPPKSNWYKFRMGLLRMSNNPKIRLMALIVAIVVVTASAFYLLAHKVGAATTKRIPATQEAPLTPSPPKSQTSELFFERGTTYSPIPEGEDYLLLPVEETATKSGLIPASGVDAANESEMQASVIINRL